MNKVRTLLYLQFFVLLGGTLFAWYQWYMEYFQECDSCSGETGKLFTKCFLGALFFTMALVLNIASSYLYTKKSE
jgi:hypothetical protein